MAGPQRRPPAPGGRGPVLVAAFAGWNDAGEAASSAVRHLIDVTGAQPVGEIDPEEHYDFQVHRPTVSVDGGIRVLRWPTTRVLAGALPGGPDLVLVDGLEPSHRWRGFCARLLELAGAQGVATAVTLGALLADVVHTRPVPVTGVSSDAGIVSRLALEPSGYEGPTGIVGVLQDAATRAGLPAVSFWAAVPTYVGQSACPKAAVALLRRLEDVVDTTVPLGDLPEQAADWERSVQQLAEEDADVREYVTQLEQQQAATELTETSGEHLAREFERYLRRRDTGGAGST
jgi:predicted ATP-grasp superfamily ATP-dependent carboligase